VEQDYSIPISLPMIKETSGHLCKKLLRISPKGRLLLTVRIGSSLTDRRPGLWSEIGGTCLMLASPAGGYFNGATLVVDGGWLLTASANDV